MEEELMIYTGDKNWDFFNTVMTFHVWKDDKDPKIIGVVQDLIRTYDDDNIEIALQIMRKYGTD